MKKNPLIPPLIGVLALLTAFGALSTWNTYVYSKRGRALQVKAVHINNTRLVMDALAKDALEYSTRQPAIDPILISVGIKQPAGTPPAKKPATR